MAKFIIIKPRKAVSRLSLNLIKDAGGSVVEKNALGIVVQCKASIGHALNLPELIHVDEVVEIVRG